MRKQKSGMPALVKVGYRGPKVARGLHPSGYTDNVVHNAAELARLDPKKDAARLGHTVGKRKRMEIIAKATELGIKVLNAGKLAPKEKDRKSTRLNSSHVKISYAVFCLKKKKKKK